MPYTPNSPATSAGPALQEEQLPQQWSELTERVELPQKKQTFAGLGEVQNLTLERVFCVAEAQIRLTLNWETPAAEEATPVLGMPQGAVKKVTLKANGVSGIISCSGRILEVREEVVYRSPTHATIAEANSKAEKIAAKTAVKWEWVIQVPIAEDLRELEGIILAQTEETALEIEVEWAKEAEIVSAGKMEKVTGSVSWALTAFSVGTMQVKGNAVLVLPDLQLLHGLTERSAQYSAEGEQEAPLTRTSGDLLRYYFNVFKEGLKVEFDILNLLYVFLQFGGNQKPENWADPKLLAERNARDYLKRPMVKENVHYGVIDRVLDDAQRDAIKPMMLSELKLIVGIPEAPGTNARIYSAQETLYPAEA